MSDYRARHCERLRAAGLPTPRRAPQSARCWRDRAGGRPTGECAAELAVGSESRARRAWNVVMILSSTTLGASCQHSARGATTVHASHGFAGAPPTKPNGPSDSGSTRSAGIAATASRPARLDSMDGPTENQQFISAARATCRALPTNQCRTNCPAPGSRARASSTAPAAPRLWMESVLPPTSRQSCSTASNTARCVANVWRWARLPSRPTSPTYRVRGRSRSKSASSWLRAAASSG
jgi:hypothetical protein